MKDLSKPLIRIIQDYCFANNASIFCDRFSIFLNNKIIQLLRKKEFNTSEFIKISKVRKDFFVANDIINIKLFCKGLFEEINKELNYCKEEDFYNFIIRMKYKFEDGLVKRLNKEKTEENELKGILAAFINEETFLEAEMNGGKSDICVPEEKVVIETKLWKGEEYYKSGFPELDTYLENRRYSEGFYVNFDYNYGGCNYSNINNGIFDLEYNNKLIHIIFIKMKPIEPSKKYKINKLKGKKQK